MQCIAILFFIVYCPIIAASFLYNRTQRDSRRVVSFKEAQKSDDNYINIQAAENGWEDISIKPVWKNAEFYSITNKTQNYCVVEKRYKDKKSQFVMNPGSIHFIQRPFVFDEKYDKQSIDLTVQALYLITSREVRKQLTIQKRITSSQALVFKRFGSPILIQAQISKIIDNEKEVIQFDAALNLYSKGSIVKIPASKVYPFNSSEKSLLTVEVYSTPNAKVDVPLDAVVWNICDSL